MMETEKLRARYIDDRPKIIDNLLQIVRNELLFESSIFSNFKKSDIFIAPPMNHEEYWWFIADAEVRIIPFVGCDRLNITKPKLLFVKFNIFYKGKHVSSAEVNYNFITEKHLIKNFTHIEKDFSTKICKICDHLLSDCQHNPEKEWESVLSSSDILYVNEPKQEDQKRVDVSKFSALLAGMSKTLRLKAKNNLSKLAEQIISENPDIKEEELAQQLLKRSSEMQR